MTNQRWLVFLAILLAPAYAGAQTRTLAGTVVDDSGAALPGAVVVLTPAAGGNPRETVTDAAGHFALSNIESGSARLRADLRRLPGKRDDRQVAAEGRTDVTVKMKVGFDEEVTVAADAAAGVLSPARNANAVEFDPEALRRLPTEAQDLQTLVESFAAGMPGAVSVVIDGVESDALGMPSAAIHRLLINRNPYATEYRSPGKSRVEVETERGSRRFYHGSGALFLRDAKFDARNAFAISTPESSRTLGEGTLGGPLPGKGWSFFTTAQHLVNDQAAIVDAETPSGPVRQNLVTPERRSTMLGRADYRPNKTDALTFRYDLFDDLERDHGVGGFRLAEQAYTTDERRHRLLVGDRRIVSTAALNDLRVEGVVSQRDDGSPAFAPAVVVAGAFTGGAPQTFARDRTGSIQVQEIATMTIGARAVRAGGSIKARSADVMDVDNFGGTYLFRSLADFARRAPYLLVRRAGDPHTSFVQTDGSAFVDTTLRPSDTMSVTAGVRYDWQSDVADWNNLSPRVTVAVAPAGSKMVFRGGAGLFYQTVSPEVFVRTRLFGDGGLREAAIANPSFPALPPEAVVVAPGAIWTLGPGLAMPMTMQASAGVERALWRKTSVAVEYLSMRSSTALRARDVNAPRVDTGRRPDPSRVNVFAVTSTGTSRTDALTGTFRGRLAGFKGTIEYRLSRTIDDASDAFALPADSNDLAAERGRADFDRRHRFSLAGAYGWKKDRIRLGTVFTAWSGAPFDIVSGADTNHDLVATDRPAGVSRNIGDGPGYAQLDLRFTTVFRAPRPPSKDPESAKREQTDNFELNLDVFNVTNRINPTTFVGVITSPLFGHANTARPARSAQLSLRYRF